jgi:hypothetical protein
MTGLCFWELLARAITALAYENNVKLLNNVRSLLTF